MERESITNLLVVQACKFWIVWYWELTMDARGVTRCRISELYNALQSFILGCSLREYILYTGVVG